MQNSLASATRLKNLSLGRRGRKARTTVTEQEVKFCGLYVGTGNVRQSSLAAGFNEYWGYSLLKTPRIKTLVAEFEQKKKDEGWEAAKAQVAVTREFLDAEFISRLVNMTTHDRIGDLAIVRMFEAGYKRTGDILPARVSVSQQQAQQQTGAPPATAFQVYKSKWLREKEARWKHELEQRGDCS